MCAKENRCNWFTWRDASNPKGCLLLSQKGDTKDVDHGRNRGATGPKSCQGRHIDSENRIFVDRTNFTKSLIHLKSERIINVNFMPMTP